MYVWSWDLWIDSFHFIWRKNYYGFPLQTPTLYAASRCLGSEGAQATEKDIFAVLCAYKIFTVQSTKFMQSRKSPPMVGFRFCDLKVAEAGGESCHIFPFCKQTKSIQKRHVRQTKWFPRQTMQYCKIDIAIVQEVHTCYCSIRNVAQIFAA